MRCDSSEAIITVLGSIRLSSKQILTAARDLDTRIPQGMVELLRSKWSSENSHLNTLLSEIELKAMTPPLVTN